MKMGLKSKVNLILDEMVNEDIGELNENKMRNGILE